MQSIRLRSHLSAALLVIMCVGTGKGWSSGLTGTESNTGERSEHVRDGFYFPPAGESLTQQNRRRPEEVGLRPEIVPRLNEMIKGRWALWRNGFLVHVEGDFNEVSEVKSLRKTWHALTVGAAIQQGRIPSYHQQLGIWVPELEGKHAQATWWHVITQTSAFDYPYGGFPSYRPGEIWTYSDKNPKYLCSALARAYGRRSYQDHYEEILSDAYFDAIGMSGWRIHAREDGVRLYLDLEDMGRLGLLVLARGTWNSREIIPRWFVEELERKQTDGIPVNYAGPDDGKVPLDVARFREVPYGFMTWTNTDLDYFPGADRAWAWGAGAGGHCVFWNHRNGIVLAGVAVDTRPTSHGIPQLIEEHMLGANPRTVLRPQVGAVPGSSERVPGEEDLPLKMKKLGPVGQFPKWGPVEIEFQGPYLTSSSTPNPFAILMDVIFEGPGGRKSRVPAFYDGDGRGGSEGSVWKARFSADEEGLWKFVSTSFDRQLDGYSGTFAVTPIPPDAANFYRWGRLECVGTSQNQIRYLRFRDGPYWLKAGCDDPENFLGSARHFDTLAKRKAAVDYLAKKGVNSLYILTHNLDGDDQDVWPWLGSSPEIAKTNAVASPRFDIAKLQEWRQLLEHMQKVGVVPYLVLEDDSAWSGYDHGRYYREMVARFGDLPALLFNIGEEHNENYPLSEALGFAWQMTKMDPYGHPMGIHNVNTPRAEYVDAIQVSFTSIQTNVGDALSHNRLATEWIKLCRTRHRRILMVGVDEGRPEEDRGQWWQAYLGGAVWEAHVRAPYDRPLSAWDILWTQLGGTRAFMESVPFWEMEPHNSLIKSGRAYCLAKPPETYALYLPQGGEISVELHPGFTYDYAWWRAENGWNSKFQNQGTAEGGRRFFNAPGSGDWALRITKR